MTQHTTDTLRAMMQAYASPRHSVVGMALSEGEAQFVRLGKDHAETPPGDLIFEIGSITKVFTAILLCVLAEEGRIDPRAPLRDLSDDLAMVPDWITPERLTSHTSGLPRLHVPIWKALIKPLPKDPYAAFSRDDLLDWLRIWSRTARPAKAHHAYSNLGVGLLGEAMAMHEGTPFMDLLTRKVLDPLGLRDTTDVLSADQHTRFVQPRDTKGRDAVPWTFRAMAGAGCLRASARDLARLATRVMKSLSDPKTPLDNAICRSAQPSIGRGPRGALEPMAQAAGWLSVKLDAGAPRMLHHDGGTAGSTSALYICPEKGAALAILSNNGLAANMLASVKLSWTNQLRQAQDHFSEL